MPSFAAAGKFVHVLAKSTKIPQIEILTWGTDDGFGP